MDRNDRIAAKGYLCQMYVITLADSIQAGGIAGRKYLISSYGGLPIVPSWRYINRIGVPQAKSIQVLDFLGSSKIARGAMKSGVKSRSI